MFTIKKSIFGFFLSLIFLLLIPPVISKSAVVPFVPSNKECTSLLDIYRYASELKAGGYPYIIQRKLVGSGQKGVFARYEETFYIRWYAPGTVLKSVKSVFMDKQYFEIETLKMGSIGCSSFEQFTPTGRDSAFCGVSINLTSTDAIAAVNSFTKPITQYSDAYALAVSSGHGNFLSSSVVDVWTPNGWTPDSYIIPEGSPIISDNEDIESFQWYGDGIRISKPKDNDIISGYLDTTKTTKVNYFDVMIYGKFHYKPHFWEFDSKVELKATNMVINFNGVDYVMYNNVSFTGITPSVVTPTFKWIIAPGDDAENLCEFTVCLQLPCDKAVSDLTVTASLPSLTIDNWFTQKIHNITITQDGRDIAIDGYKPPTPGQISGAGDDSSNKIVDPNASVGVNADGSPISPGDSGTVIDWIKYFFAYLTYIIKIPFIAIGDLIISLTSFLSSTLDGLKNVFAFMSSSFSFIPEVVQKAIWSVVMVSLISIIIGFFVRR